MITFLIRWNLFFMNRNKNSYIDSYDDYKEDINIETICAHIRKVKRIPPCDIEIMLPELKILTSSNYRLRMNYIIDYLDYLKKILEIKIEFIDNCSSIKNV